MDRDDFARMKARQDIVTAFINKLEKADMSDINLIPALMDYVNTGDRTLFDEYNNFRKVTDTEKKAKEMEERLTEAQANLKSREAEWEKTQRLSNEYRSKINDAIFKYQQWLQEMRETTVKENPQAEFPNMKALRDFAQICIDESTNGYQRKLWLKDGDKLKTVTAILFDGKKAVMEVGEPTTILTPVPKY